MVGSDEVVAAENISMVVVETVYFDIFFVVLIQVIAKVVEPFIIFFLNMDFKDQVVACKGNAEVVFYDANYEVSKEEENDAIDRIANGNNVERMVTLDVHVIYNVVDFLFNDRILANVVDLNVYDIDVFIIHET